MSLINAHDLRVCVHTTWWNRDEKKFAFYRGWPSGKKDVAPLKELEDLWNMQSRKKKKPCVDVSLFQALTNRSTCSSYLVQYAPTALNVRLRQQVLNPEPQKILFGADPNGIQMILAVFDLDCHESDNANEWFNQQIPRLERLLKDHPGLFIYQSKGGMRILGVLSKPMPIKSHEDADRWTQYYGACCNYLARKYGLRTEGKETVDKLADWTRYQRVPHDCRVQGEESSEYETIGDPEWVGTWEPSLEGVDWPVRNAVSREHLEYTGECQLVDLVKMSGLEWEEAAPDIYDIHCPDHRCHSDSTHRKTKTILYANGPIGKIECKSSTCQSKHPDKNISYFSSFKPEHVVAVSKTWMFDPLVLKIQDRMDKRSEKIDFDTPDDAQVLNDQQADYLLLQKAIELACIPKNIDTLALGLWFVKQKKYKNPKDSEAKVAFLLTVL